MEARLEKKTMSVAWIDFSKAYDRVPHGWQRKCLKAVRAPGIVRQGLKAIMPCWTTTLEIRLEDGSLMKKPVNFRRGLFQGDRLSPLLFALSIAPLSEMLTARGGVNSAFQRCPVSHLLFMDDLKFYERTWDELGATM